MLRLTNDEKYELNEIKFRNHHLSAILYKGVYRENEYYMPNLSDLLLEYMASTLSKEA